MAEVLFLPPFVFFVGALLVAVAPSALRGPLALLTPVAALAALAQIDDGAQISTTFLSYEIAVVDGSVLRRLFAAAFALVAFCAALFSFGRSKGWELAAGLGLAGGAAGVALAGDLIAMFLYWEVMALCATLLIWSGGQASGQGAGIRYITLHLLRGLFLKFGIEEVLLGTGSIAVRPLLLEDPGSWILLGAILVSAAAPPVSFWVADAYPESTPRSNVWLSAFTTATGLLALLLLFPGSTVLIGLGVWMVSYGILYSLLQGRVRKALSYSIVAQAGFVVAAVGVGSPASLNFAATVAIGSIFAIALLHMSAAVVEESTGTLRFGEVGGLKARMPLASIGGTVGAASLVLLPVVAAAASPIAVTAVTALLLVGLAGTVLHMGLRFPLLLFFQGEAPGGAADATGSARAALLVTSVASLGILVPGLLSAGLPFPGEGTTPNLGTLLFLLAAVGGSALLARLILPRLPSGGGIRWDWDCLYRKQGLSLLRGSLSLGGAIWKGIEAGPLRLLKRLLIGLSRSHGPQGSLARSWPSGSMALWVGVILGAYLLFSFL